MMVVATINADIVLVVVCIVNTHTNRYYTDKAGFTQYILNVVYDTSLEWISFIFDFELCRLDLK